MTTNESSLNDKHLPPSIWQPRRPAIRSTLPAFQRLPKGTQIRDYTASGRTQRKWADVSWDTFIFTTSEEVQKERIEGLFSSESWTEVRVFLDKHPFLAELLFEVDAQVRRYFEGAEVSLEVIVDPEGLSEEHLTAYIHTSLSPEEAANQLDQLNEEWWLDTLQQGRQKLFINLAFL